MPMRGVPWKPPTQHLRTLIRTHISEEHEDVMEDGAEGDEIHMRRDDDDHQDDRIKKVEEAQKIIQHRMGQS